MGVSTHGQGGDDKGGYPYTYVVTFTNFAFTTHHQGSKMTIARPSVGV